MCLVLWYLYDFHLPFSKMIHGCLVIMQRPTSPQTTHIPVKHDGGRLMIWASFAATGLGHLAVTESTMNVFVCQYILKSNVRPSFWSLKPGLTLSHATGQWSQTQHQIYNRMSEKESRCCNNPVTSFKELWINKWPQTSRNWNKIKKKSGTKFLHNDVGNWNIIQKTITSELLLLKVVPQAFESWGELRFSHTASAFLLSFYIYKIDI